MQRFREIYPPQRGPITASTAVIVALCSGPGNGLFRYVGARPAEGSIGSIDGPFVQTYLSLSPVLWHGANHVAIAFFGGGRLLLSAGCRSVGPREGRFEADRGSLGDSRSKRVRTSRVGPLELDGKRRRGRTLLVYDS